MAESSTSSATAAPAVPSLTPQGQHAGKPALPLGRPFTLIGSRHRAHLHLLSRSVSKSHAAIISTEAGLYIRDLASREHVYINGKPVKEAELRNGDLLQVGTFKFQYSDPAASTRPRVVPRAAEGVICINGVDLPIQIDGRTLVIGRRPTCDLALTELSASTIHAIIFEVNGQRYIRDMGSRTGTFVNGRPVHHHPLQLNDRIRIGETEMRYAAAGAAGELDELDQLLGTAALGQEAEGLAIDPTDLSPAKLAARRALEQVNRAAMEPPAAPEHREPPLRIVPDDDEIPLAPVEPIEAEAPAPTAPAAHYAEIEPAEPAIEVAATIPLASDDAPIPIEPEEAIPSADAAEKHEEINLGDDDRHFTADTHLHPERLSGSGTFVDVGTGPRQEPAEQSTIPIDLGLDIWAEENAPVPVADESPAEEGPVSHAPRELEREEALPIAPDEEAPASVEPSAAEGEPEQAFTAQGGLLDEHLEEAIPAASEPAPESFVAETETVCAVPIEEELGLTPEAPATVEDLELPQEIQPEQDLPPVAEAPAPATTEPPAPVIAPIVEMPVEIAVPPPVVNPSAAVAALIAGSVDLTPGKKKRKPPKPRKGRGERAQKKQTEVAPPEALRVAEIAPPEPLPAPEVAPEIEPLPAEVPVEELRDIEPASPEPVEVIDRTEATPESAQPLEAQVASPVDELQAEFQPLQAENTSDLSDTSFGRTIEELDGAEFGTLVEEGPVQPAGEADHAIEVPTEVEQVLQPEPVAPVEAISKPVLEDLLGEESAPLTDAMVEEAIAFLQHEDTEPEHADQQAPAPPPIAEEVVGPAVTPQPDFQPPTFESPALAPVPDLDFIALAPAAQGIPPTAPPAEDQEAELNIEDLLVDEPLIPAPPSRPGPAQAEAPAGLDDLIFESEAAEPAAQTPAVTEEVTEESLESAIAQSTPPAEPNTRQADVEALAPENRGPVGEPPPPEGTPPSLSLDEVMAGMGRDVGSFLGGLPLGMNPVVPPVAPGVTVQVPPKSPARPAPPQGRATPGLADPDDLFETSTEALDELPEGLDAIADETHAVGDRGAPAPRPPAQPTAKSPATSRPRPVAPPPPARGTRAPLDPLLDDEDLILTSSRSAGPAPRGKPGGAFDGLALPPVEQIDVFSMLPTPGPDDPFLDAGAAPAGPQPAKPNAPAQRPGRGAVPVRPAQPTPFADVPAGSLTRQTSNTIESPQDLPGHVPPAAPPGASPGPKRKKWGLFSLLLPLLFMGGAGATYVFWPAQYRLTATMQFDGAEKLSTLQQKDLESKLRRQLLEPAVKSTARDAFDSGSGIRQAGFFANGVEYDRVVQSGKIDGNRFVLQYKTRDMAGDRDRVSALLRALYQANGPMRDKAASVRSQQPQVQRDFDQVQAEIQSLEQQTQSDMVAETQRGAATGSEHSASAKLQAAEGDFAAATHQVNQLQDELNTMQAASAVVESDAQVEDLSRRLKQLDSLLSAASQGADLKKASADLESALADLHQQLEAIRSAPAVEPSLAEALSAADKAQSQVKFAASTLLGRQNDDEQRVSALKSRLASSPRTAAPQPASDPQFVELQQRWAVADRQANTALESNLPDEAKRLRGIADDLKRQLDQRRAAVANSVHSPELTELLGEIQQNVQRGTQQLRDALDRLVSAMPASDKVSVDQRIAVDQLARSARQVQDVGEQFAAALVVSSPAGKPDPQQLQADHAQVQAQLDARQKQLVTDNPQASDLQTLAKKRGDLDAAQILLARAQQARDDAKSKLADARAALAKLPTSTASVAADNQKLAVLQTRRDSLRRDIEQFNATALVVPQNPADADAILAQADPNDLMARCVVAASIFALGLLVAGFLWLRSNAPAEPPMARYTPAHPGEHEAVDERQALAM